MVGYRRDEALPSCHRPDRLLADNPHLPPRGDGALLVPPSVFSSEGQSLAGTIPENSWAIYVTAERWFWSGYYGKAMLSVCLPVRAQAAEPPGNRAGPATG